MAGSYTLHLWYRREVHARFWHESPKERDRCEGLGVDGRTLLK
jgi:hypothetical protein